MHNPAPVTRPKTANARLNAGAPLKRDINLISNREAQERIARRGLFIILGVVVLLGIGYFAFYIPLVAGKALDLAYQDASNQLSAYTSTDADFTSLSAQAKTLQAMVDSLDVSSSQQKSAYDILQMVKGASPAAIVYTDIEYSINDVTLTGLADKDSDVAQLVVNLQSYPQFAQVTISSVAPNDAEPDPNDAEQPVTATKARMFTVVAAFPVPVVQPAAPAAAPTTQTNGGSGS